MDFQGVNQGVERTDIAPGESPDATNCFYHDGRLGLLGQRKGKTFTNATAYAANVMGAPVLVSPGGSRYWQVGLTDGSIGQDAAPQASEPSAGLSTTIYRRYGYTSTGSISDAWPNWYSESVVTLDTPIAAGSYQILIPREFAITLSITGGNQEGNFSLFWWFKDSGNNTISGLDQLFVLNYAGDGLVIAAEPSTFLKGSLTLSGTATSILIRINFGADPSVASYSYTAGPFTGFYLRAA